jgi:hypothetical protein
LSGTQPLGLATSGPINRKSSFRDESWHSDNRPSYSLKTIGADSKPIEYVKPGQSFIVEFKIFSKSQRLKKYEEKFCLVKEGDGVIPNTEITLSIHVVS